MMNIQGKTYIYIIWINIEWILIGCASTPKHECLVTVSGHKIKRQWKQEKHALYIWNDRNLL
jgi:hypothetical protein